jgi:hypothetical protein
LTHHFSIGWQEGYAIVGLYEDGVPGEMFIRMAKEGSTVSGLMDSFATAVSLALQYGVPLQVLCDKVSHTRFEPSGWSGNPQDRLRHCEMRRGGRSSRSRPTPIPRLSEPNLEKPRTKTGKSLALRFVVPI